ncbi:ABC transporter substrate-binding protein [Treponema vincentii]|uniref:ABC transporter substrate-binding protein n=1 Tax=Treponema vincentii TaxID=69710 RepID=UPI0020A34E0E|nr:ABC transporter substrate-binding protein [Treponema vincentii]
MNMKNFLFAAALTCCMLTACKNAEDSIAVIWTDRIEFISYCEAFNSAQSRYKIVVSYKENPSDALTNTSEQPDIVIGPWLRGDATRVKFSKLGGILSKTKIDPDIFYPLLFELGNINGAQYLLPVSFNLPTVIFSASQKNLVKTNFTLSLEEMRTLAAEYNSKNGSEYTKMGFSPRWDTDFLYVSAQGFNVFFEETKNFFSWNDKALQELIAYTRRWSEEVNTDAAAEDEFQFKYLYDPPYTLVTNGRCLFWYMPSDKLFSLNNEKLKSLDYRWMNYNGKTPLQDEIIYAGICKKAKNTAAARAFLLWFFNEESQKNLLARSQTDNMIAPSFGLAGGFSSLKNVTENIFPVYYPLLLKHLPQTDDFSAPRILPHNWLLLKKEIIFPYLRDQTRMLTGDEKPASLNRRLSDWYKKPR